MKNELSAQSTEQTLKQEADRMGGACQVVPTSAILPATADLVPPATTEDCQTHGLAVDVDLRACEVGYVEDGEFAPNDENECASEYLPLVEKWFALKNNIRSVGQAGRWTYFLLGMEERWVAARIGGLADGWIEVLSDEIRSTREEANPDVVLWCEQEGIVLHDVKATTVTDNRQDKMQKNLASLRLSEDDWIEIDYALHFTLTNSDAVQGTDSVPRKWRVHLRRIMRDIEREYSV